MKVTVNENVKRVPLSSLKPGDGFMWSEYIYMVLRNDKAIVWDDPVIPVLRFGKPDVRHFGTDESDVLVIPVDLEVIVTPK